MLIKCLSSCLEIIYLPKSTNKLVLWSNKRWKLTNIRAASSYVLPRQVKLERKATLYTPLTFNINVYSFTTQSHFIIHQYSLRIMTIEIQCTPLYSVEMQCMNLQIVLKISTTDTDLQILTELRILTEKTTVISYWFKTTWSKIIGVRTIILLPSLCTNSNNKRLQRNFKCRGNTQFWTELFCWWQ